MKKSLPFLLPCLLLLAACEKAPDTAAQNTAPATPAPAEAPATAAAPAPAPAAEPALQPVPALSKEERDKRVADATRGFRKEAAQGSDQVYYTAKDTALYKDKLSSYIAVPEQGPALLRMVLAHQGPNAAAFDAMTVTADGATVLQKDFPSQDVQTGSNEGGKFVTVDFVARATDVLALEKMVDAKDVKIALTGKDKSTELDLSSKARKQLKDTLAAYAALDALKAPAP